MSELSEDEITQKLVVDCMQRMISGDVDAGNALAQLYLGKIPSNEIYLHLAVVEALILQSAQLGSIDAQEHLKDMWPTLKEIFVRRLSRRGMT
ncbi:MAG: hypothetical protein Q7U23_14205 [Methylococcales bacterium]|nr:hypothetical protein [Methylococcales bacterium]